MASFLCRLCIDERTLVLKSSLPALQQLPIDAGGNIYLAKFAGIFGLNVRDVGAQQTGMSVEDFKAMLVKQGE